MNLSKKLKLMFRQILMKAGSMDTDRAVLLWDGEGELAEGMEVFVEETDAEGNVNYVSPEDGEFTAEGIKIVIEGGVVKSIVKVDDTTEDTKEDVVEENMAEEEKPATDPVDEEAVEEAAKMEDRVAALEAKIVEIATGIETMLNSIAAFETRLAEVENKLAAVEGKPAADPAEDKPIEEEETQKKSRMSYLRKD